MTDTTDPIPEDPLEPRDEIVSEIVSDPFVEPQPAEIESESENESVAEPLPTPETEDVGEVVPEETPAEPAPPAKPVSNLRWYAVKVQSGREESIKAAIERRVKIEGVEEYFGRIAIPIERKTTTDKNGRRITRKSKKFPGYIMAEVEFNDQILYLFRETSGVGDFVGHAPLEKVPKAPLPMTDEEVRNMLDEGSPDGEKADGEKRAGVKPGKQTKTPLLGRGDRVRIKEGMFSDMEGTVKDILEPKDATSTHRYVVELMIWGRPTPAELSPNQVEAI